MLRLWRRASIFRRDGKAMPSFPNVIEQPYKARALVGNESILLSFIHIMTTGVMSQEPTSMYGHYPILRWYDYKNSDGKYQLVPWTRERSVS